MKAPATLVKALPPHFTFSTFEKQEEGRRRLVTALAAGALVTTHNYSSSLQLGFAVTTTFLMLWEGADSIELRVVGCPWAVQAGHRGK